VGRTISVKTKEKPALRTVHKVGIAIVAAPSAWFLTFIPELIVSSMRPGMKFITFGISYAASCYLWKWLFLDSEVKARKKLPMTSKERRENIKRFYDGLSR